MIGRLIEWSLKNRLLVLLALLALVAAGIGALRTLPLDAVPDVTNEQVQILTSAPALSPPEIEKFITFPVESAMSGIPRVNGIRSISKFGLSVVTVIFEEGTDIYWARQQIGERLGAAREMIPEGYGSPELGPISTGLGEIYQFEVRGDPMCPANQPETDGCWTPMKLRTLLDWQISFRLRAVPGVVEINQFGGEAKRFEVRVQPEKLLSYGLSMEDLFQALQKNNLVAGGAYLEHAGEQRLIRGEALLGNLEDIRRVPVKATADGTPVLMGMVAEVGIGAMIRQGAVTRDGRGEAVTGIVMMLKGGNSRAVSGDVKAAVEEIAKSLPPGVRIDTFYNRSDMVDTAVHTVVKNLVEGGFLVILVLLLFLGNIRAGLIVAASIPLSMLAAFILMNQFGISGNLMSLGSIDFGLIVDGSVIMIEHILRRLEQREEHLSPLTTIREAAVEVAGPVTVAVGIIMAVYLPIMSLQGVEGKMFRPMAFTVVFAMAGSLLLALTLMPVLATFLLAKQKSAHANRLMDFLEKKYRTALERVLKRPRAVVLSAAGLFVISLFVFHLLGSEFIPKLDEGSLAIQAWRLPSVSLTQANLDTTIIEQTLLRKFPGEVSTVVCKTGRAEIATDPMGVDVSDIYVGLKPKKSWKKAHDKADLVEQFAKALDAAVPGVKFSFSQPVELRMQELIAGVRSDVAVQIFGDDLKTLGELADQVTQVLSRVPGAADAKPEQVGGLPYLTIKLNRAAAARYGVDAEAVMAAIQTARAGREAGTVFEGQARFPLVLTVARSAVKDKTDLLTLPVASRAGMLIPLGQLATLEEEEGANQISREAISRRISVEVNVRGRDLGSFVADAQKAVADKVRMPPGYHLEWGGQFQNLQRATSRLLILVPLTLALIFLLLFMSFKSMPLAALIYVNVPLAVIGGIFALWLRGMPFSISAGVGFIALFGVAVLNGVVMISQIRTLRQEGLSPAEAAFKGAVDRLRSNITTALVAGLGFVPMAIATSAGAEVQRPLATVVIGGLLSSTLLTLFVLPALYPWFDRKPTEF